MIFSSIRLTAGLTVAVLSGTHLTEQMERAGKVFFIGISDHLADLSDPITGVLEKPLGFLHLHLHDVIGEVLSAFFPVSYTHLDVYKRQLIRHHAFSQQINHI